MQSHRCHCGRPASEPRLEQVPKVTCVPDKVEKALLLSAANHRDLLETKFCLEKKQIIENHIHQ